MEGLKKSIALDDEKIQATIYRLYLRISDRFPDSSLAAVCQKVYDLSRQTRQTLRWISTPNWPLRLGVYAFILLLALVLIVSLCQIELSTDRISWADFVQVTDAFLNQIVLISAGIFFLVTLENRRKRQRVIKAINRLRSLAHIVDAHQLTKDPERLYNLKTATEHSPTRDMTDYNLGRYLDYCTELLSLIGKLGFLYVQDFHDPTATGAVNDLESLTTGLSRKIWQKIMILHPQTELLPPRSPSEKPTAPQ